MLAKIEFKPGITKDETALASEGGWVDGDRVRFVRGKLQTLGGWSLKSPLPFNGVARAAHDWADLSGKRLLAWGTTTNLYVLSGGATIDITPPLAEGVLTDPFAATLGSSVVTVRHPGHGLNNGDSVTFANATPTGGLTLNGTYPITKVDDDSYTIVAGSNATSTATSGATGTVDFSAPLPAGNVDGFVSGWGSGSWGEGPWGGSGGGDGYPRIWSLDNFGQNLLANPRGRGIYEWQPSFQPPEIVRNGGFSTDTEWNKGPNWTISGGTANKAAGTATNIDQALNMAMEAGRVYRLTFNVAVTTPGTLQFRINAGLPTPAFTEVGTASIKVTRSGSYSRLFRAPVNPQNIVWTSDTAFAGSLDQVSIRLETKAYRIDEAPHNVDWMFVDPARIVVALACQEFGGTFNPMLVRWSAQEDVHDWTPATDNLSGELPLSNGSRVLSGLPSRQQDLIFTDTALFGLQFTGTTDGFTQRLLGTGCGLIGRNAAVEYNGTAFWMSRNGFFLSQGSAPQKIPCDSERYVLDNLAPLQDEKIYAGVHPQFSEIWWLYADARDGNECSRVAVFNFAENHWSFHTIARTAWLAAGLFDHPIAFSPDGFMYEHEVGNTANGAPLMWRARSGAFDIEDGENLVIVDEIVPDVEDQVGSVTFAVSGRMYPNSADLPTQTFTAATSTDTLRPRFKARQATVEISSMDAPSFYRSGALRFGIRKAAATR